MNKLKKAILFTISVALFSGCSNDNTVFEGKKDFKKGYWLWQEPVIFEFSVPDAGQKYNLSYFIRNSIDYEHYNLYLKHFIEDSAGNVISKKLNNVLLFEPKTGKPIGDGIGDIFNLKKDFLTDFTFPSAGQYTLRIDQYMRLDTLRHIHTIGIQVSAEENPGE